MPDVNVVCDGFLMHERNSDCFPGLQYYSATSQLSLAFAYGSECNLLTEHICLLRANGIGEKRNIYSDKAFKN
jgi:hypothetical protein